jgi:hypothetical protein
MLTRSEEKVEFEKSLGFEDDEIKLARRIGMFAYELFPLHNHCVDEEMYVIARTSSETRREFAYTSGTFAKHGGIKKKTSKQTTPGLIVYGKNDPKPRPPKRNKGLFNDMFKDGVQRYYSDIDLMSAWKHTGEKIDTNSIDFQYLINIPLGREVMHGGNDDFYHAKTGAFLGRKNIKKHDDFLVFGKDATPFIIEGFDNLEDWYRRDWPHFTSTLKFKTTRGVLVDMNVWPY